MNTSSRLLVLCSLLALPAEAFAGTKSIDFNKSDFAPTGAGAVIDVDLSIRMPDATTTGAMFSFALPKNYKKNSTAKLKLIFAGDAAGPCNFSIVPFTTYRQRVGFPESNANIPALSGFSAAAPGPTPLPANTGILTFAKDFKLKKATGFAVTGQKAGDIITLAIERRGADAADTCSGQLRLLGARLTYQSN